jgi:hypothetical protein
MGIWCLAAFAKTSDPFAQISSFSLTIAYGPARLPGQDCASGERSGRGDKAKRLSWR